VSGVDDTMPPVIGTAVRRITSAPVPWLHVIGNWPATIAATVMPQKLDRPPCAARLRAPIYRSCSTREC
jgi:hypothetical protein